MKKVLYILTIGILLSACDSGSENSTESVIESNNAENIQKKRNELADQQAQLQTEIAKLDDKLKELNPERNIPLVTAYTIESNNFDHFIELQGNTETRKNVVINGELNGILEKIYVEEGQKVSKGQTLAKIDDGGLSQQLAQMQVQLNLAKTTFERQKRLWDQQIGSEIQFLQAKSDYEAQVEAVKQMKSQVAKSVITAPFSGTVDQIITEEGNLVTPGQTQIFRIINLDDMYVNTDVPESYISSVEPGKTVEVTFPVLGKTIEAKVKQVGNYINPNNRTFEVEIDVPNKDKQIKPNLTARVKINDYSSQEAILVPQDIISENAEGEQYLYLLDSVNNEKAVAKQVIIETGKTSGDNIEVLKGLQQGDQIIQEGARSVKEGQTVKIMNY